MRGGCNCASIPGALSALLILSCSSPSRMSNAILLEEGYRPSRTSLFEFRLPIGWLEVPSGEGASDIELWLVSADFQQSIEVSVLFIDSTSGMMSRPESIVRIRMQMMLESGETITDSVRAFVDGDRTLWSYTASDRSGHLRRVCVCDVGSKCVEVRMLLRNPPSEGQKWTIGDEFVRELLWRREEG